MSKQFQKHHFYPLSEALFEILDPVLRKRAGLNVMLVKNWQQIVGHDVGKHTVPLKIIWKGCSNPDEPFQPATLVVACEGFAALKLIHETDELLHRINAFFGYIAIDRIKIKQRHISSTMEDLPVHLAPNEGDKKRVEKMIKEITDKDLRQSLYELGCSIFAEKNNE
ncbi:DUF721 domain-containing protein [Bartonella sp. CB178]|uniref:DUF721 domain-containing protein n=1 Tax=Bartonella sp. CB178 TaxID=3112255 RepID=UPI00300DFA07